ncbi:MAG: hypothetical protein DMG08_00210 [Acidobacteria bacterium]|nr:MAG: hypothetical protein DMG08_00210 [Acidobacteriota bacterium]
MPDTVHRLIKTLRLIPRPPRKTEASEIRRRLETDGFAVTLRTVQRDLNHLAVHFPIRGDANKPQGWCWSGDPILIPVLDPQSALTLKLVEQFLQPLLPSATLQSLAEQFASAGKALSNSSRLAAWPRKVRAVPRAFPLLPPKIDPKVQATIYEGLLENRQVSIQYRSRDCGEPKEHTIHPLGIVIRDQLVYLVCTFYDYDDVRQLALHRIEAAHLLPDKASRPKHFNLDEYIEEGAFSYPVTGKRIRFRALFGAGAAEHLFWWRPRFSTARRCAGGFSASDPPSRSCPRLNCGRSSSKWLRIWRHSTAPAFREIRGIRGQQNSHEFHELTRIGFFTPSKRIQARTIARFSDFSDW